MKQNERNSKNCSRKPCIRIAAGMLALWIAAVLPAQAGDRTIPDRFNTGVAEGTALTSVTGEGEYQGIRYRTGAGGQLVLEFAYANHQTGAEVTIRDLDFSGVTLLCANEQKVTAEKKIIFQNCRFSAVVTGREDALVSYVFENCTLRNFQGSNAAFYRCRFGGSSADALNPYRNVQLSDCYIADLAHPEETAQIHSDGIQIFGYPGLVAENISLDNCRFEVPALPGGSGYVNACLMIAPEKSGAKGIHVTDCILNGGGYAIYTTVKEGFALEDVVLRNLTVGEAGRYGIFYHRNTTAGVTAEAVETQTRLYVGSRWKDTDGRIHFSVTNDTARERKLLIVTPYDTELIAIRGCLPYDERTADMTFADFPFDIDISVPGARWAVCYDVSGGCTQIGMYAEPRE